LIYDTPMLPPIHDQQVDLRAVSHTHRYPGTSGDRPRLPAT